MSEAVLNLYVNGQVLDEHPKIIFDKDNGPAIVKKIKTKLTELRISNNIESVKCFYSTDNEQAYELYQAEDLSTKNDPIVVNFNLLNNNNATLTFEVTLLPPAQGGRRRSRRSRKSRKSRKSRR
jgi:flagellar basal body P-ring protein FlgI